jgi:hypothetical protein
MFGNLKHSHCQLSLYGHWLDKVGCSNKTVDLFQSCTSGWLGMEGVQISMHAHTHTQMCIKL